jgi:hypothetical protein
MNNSNIIKILKDCYEKDAEKVINYFIGKTQDTYTLIDIFQKILDAEEYELLSKTFSHPDKMVFKTNPKNSGNPSYAVELVLKDESYLDLFKKNMPSENYLMVLYDICASLKTKGKEPEEEIEAEEGPAPKEEVIEEGPAHKEEVAEKVEEGPKETKKEKSDFEKGLSFEEDISEWCNYSIANDSGNTEQYHINFLDFILKPKTVEFINSGVILSDTIHKIRHRLNMCKFIFEEDETILEVYRKTCEIFDKCPKLL